MKLQEIFNKCGSEVAFAQAVEEKLRLLAVENPDFVYNPGAVGTCTYNGPAKKHTEVVGPDCNGCIFGQALQLLGWDDPYELSCRLAVNELFDSWCDNFRPPFTWREVQKQQDAGIAWGEAIKVLG